MRNLAIVFLIFLSNVLIADNITFEVGVKNKTIYKCPNVSITFELSQSACSGVLEYQWQKKVFGVFTNITNATNSTYLLTNSFNTSNTGIYRVIILSGKAQCAISNEISLEYIAPPTISLKLKSQGGQVDNFPLCTTDSIDWVVVKSGGIKPLTTTWSVTNGSKAVELKPNKDTLTIFGILNGNPKIQASVKDSFGCTTVISAAMIVKGASLKSIDTLPVTTCEGLDLNLKAKLNNTPNGNIPFTFSWVSLSNSFSVTANPAPNDSLAKIHTNSSDTAAHLLLKIFDGNTQCNARYDKYFKILPGEQLNVLQSIEDSGNKSNDNIICEGYKFQLDTIPNQGASKLTNLKWEDGNTKFPRSFIQAEDSKQYIISANDIKGCLVFDTILMNKKPNPIIKINNDEPNFSICKGNSQSLIASGTNIFEWSTGEKTNQIVVTPLVTTTYTVTGTSSDGCSASKTAIVNILPLPNITINQNTVICQNSSITLFVGGAKTYIWENGSTDSLRTVTPANTTIYKVTATSAQGCSEDTLVLISVVPSISISNFSPDITICPGTSTKLFVHVNGSNLVYKWNTNETKDTIQVNPTQTTIYTVTVTTINGCTATKSITVTVGINLNFTVPDVTICTGNTATLKVNITGSGFLYKWSNGSITDSIVVNPTITTSYTVTVTSSSGCVGTKSVTVTVQNKLIANAGVDAHICIGKSILISASGGQNYKWNTGSNSQFISVSPSITTSYIVTVSSGSCSAIDSVTIFVHDIPIANAGKDTTICSGNTINLNASGGDNYLWSTGEKSSNINVNPLISTTYTVTVSNSFGCSATDDVIINVTPKPILTISKDTSICGGQTVQLIASGGGTYKWSTNETTSSIIVTPSITSFYTVIVTNNNCSVTGTVKVEVIGNLGLVTATPDPTICKGVGVGLKVTGGSTYLWNTGAKTDSIFVNPTIDSTYSVTVSSGNCKVTKNIKVKVTDKIKAQISSNKTICIGDQVSLNAVGGSSYSWSSGQKTANITVSPTESTLYKVTVSSGILCSDTASVLVTVNKLPIVSAGKDVSICQGSSTMLKATGGVSYLWSTSESGSEINVSPNTKSTYSVTATDANGCKSTAQVSVSILARPIVSKINGDTSIKCSSPKLLYSVEHELTLAPFTYNWVISDPTVLKILNNGNLSTELSTLNKGTASLLIKVVDGNNCEGSKNLIINVEELTNLELDTIILLELGKIFLYPNLDLCMEWEQDESGTNFANPKPAPCNLVDGKTNNQLNYCDLNTKFNPAFKYRIKLYAKDSNGKCTSNGCVFFAIQIRSVGDTLSQNVATIQLFPNPTNGLAKLKFEHFENEVFMIKTYNEIGMTGVKKEIQIEHSLELIDMDFSNLSDGLHFILIQDKKGKNYKIPFMKFNEN